MTENKLQNTWVLWEHVPVDRKATAEQYRNSAYEVCEFASIEEFWKNWSFIPRPSEIFFDGKEKKLSEGRTIEAYSVFKKGIRPEWEDPVNETGSELFLKKSLPIDVLDMYWENMILGLIGETFEQDSEVCGCRVVDKSKMGKDKNSLYRLEVWLRKTEAPVIDQVRNHMTEVLTEGKQIPGISDGFILLRHKKY